MVHTHTPIYVWTVFDFRTSGFKIQNETQKENEKNVWFWFLFDLFYFLAPQFQFNLLIFVDLCCENEQLQKRPSNVVLEWNPSIG